VAGDGDLPPAAVAAAKEPCPLRKTTLLLLLKVRPWSLGYSVTLLVLKMIYNVRSVAHTCEGQKRNMDSKRAWKARSAPMGGSLLNQNTPWCSLPP